MRISTARPFLKRSLIFCLLGQKIRCKFNDFRIIFFRLNRNLADKIAKMSYMKGVCQTK